MSKANIITLAAIQTGVPMLVEARNLIDRFQAIVRQSVAADLDPWIIDARTSLVASFASGISLDRAAVCAAIIEP